MSTEYQCHRLTCPGCGEPAPAAWPAGAPRGRIGPRAQAVGALYTGAYRLAKRTPQRLFNDLFGFQVSVGTLSHLEAATEAAGAEDVPLVARRPRWYAQPVELPELYAPRTCRG